ncbi:MAG: hypothetical protein BMS9Abin37_0963 [Acidobacteriota bacterium]|nr:MAG: hypothetical protein BMS9Abin37_0963 [Acidobacteriota bacterium]
MSAASASDLIVVGGGPAGLATSIFAASQGMRVTLLERRVLPMDKPCGEGLMPEGVRLMEAMGLSVARSYPFHGIRYIDESVGAVEARFPSGHGLGMRRHDLVDANVLSEPTKPDPNPTVVQWLRDNEREFVVDPVILGEIRFGILLLPTSRRRARLELWFDEGVKRIHCVPWGASSGLRWAELLASLRTSGRAMPIKDSLIASTALVHHLMVATRNRGDFEKAGVDVVDPFP